MTDPFPSDLDGTVLVTGPSNVGKTRLTADALSLWLDANGPDGVVVLEFAPELERGGRVLGGRLDRFGPLPDDAWVGVLDAHAPRAEGESEAESAALAEANAANAATILASTPPEPRAVFVNDATIPFQHPSGDLDRLLGYCDRAACAVLNAFESDELGTADPVSRQERRALERLHAWADRSVRLDPADDE